jgi:hypothetical protein
VYGTIQLKTCQRAIFSKKYRKQHSKKSAKLRGKSQQKMVRRDSGIALPDSSAPRNEIEKIRAKNGLHISCSAICLPWQNRGEN